MGTTEWIAFGSLIFLIASGGAGVVWKLSDTKTEIIDRITTNKMAFDDELEALRIAAFTEYKELRSEMKVSLEAAYVHFGEAPIALREKISQVELFMRDTYVPKKDYEKDQERLLEVIRDLGKALEKRFDRFEDTLKEAQKNARSPN